MEERLARIEAFVLDRLSQEDRTAFEAELVADVDLAAEVAQFREAQAAAEAQGQAMLKASFREKYQAATPPRPMRLTWYLAAAATVLILVPGYWLSRPAPLTVEALYAQYSQPADLSLEREGGAEDALFIRAHELYQSGQYEEAIPLLEDLLADSVFDRKPYARLHLGLSHQQLSQWEAAREAFEVIPSGSSFYYQARWHLALISLMQEKLEDTQAHLQLLVDQSRSYGPQARELLQALQELP